MGNRLLKGLVKGLLNALHKVFPHHIPTITDWVWETMVEGNVDLLYRSQMNRYYSLAQEVINSDDVSN